MKSLLILAVFCRLLKINCAASFSSGQWIVQIENKASSSEYKEEDNHSCLMHFVDKNLIDNIYLADGALITMDRVLSTRDFLGPYEKNVAYGNLFVYPGVSRPNMNLIKRVIKIYIDHEGGSQLAVAKLVDPIVPDKFISRCTALLYFSKHIPTFEVIISGWRFTDHRIASIITTKDKFLSIIRGQCVSRELKQESYNRLSYAVATSNGEYQDHNSIMNIGDEGAPVALVTSKLQIIGIASHEKRVYITFASSQKFFISAGVTAIRQRPENE